MAAAKLRHDPDAAVVVTEVWQLFVSGCSAVDTAFVAYSLWSGGHSLWSLARWTQPLDLGCGAEDTALWSIAQVDICLEVWTRLPVPSKAHMMPKALRTASLG
ncbi:MAG: hypothetical protein FRX49_00083 [Trebouxia sp. A1-2]|nr:MAG: hypothetical protein FRX49_00083 [Trebouxia sp. A1-2]